MPAMVSRAMHPMSVIQAAILTALLAISNAQSAFATTTTQFTFFLHDNLLTVPGSSADVLIIPQLTAPLNSFYGTLVVFDDSMTTQPDPNSVEIGRGRGLYLFDAKDNQGAAIEFVWTAQFNAASGYGDGTTLSFQGFDRTTDQTREISIVGGTGTFRMARGWATISTYSLVGAAAVLSITVSFTYGS